MRAPDAKKKAPGFPGAFRMMAEWTGLEPATSGVTGQHSNRLNYHSAESENCNGHLRCLQYFIVVGAEGIEPPTRSL